MAIPIMCSLNKIALIRTVIAVVSWSLPFSVFSSNDSQMGPAINEASFYKYAIGEGFELFRRVRTSQCPVQFENVWDADYQRLRRILQIFDRASQDYEAEKAKLLNDKTWWGATASSDDAKSVMNALFAIKTAADLFLNLTDKEAPGLDHAYKYLSKSAKVYKGVTKSKEVYEFTNEVRLGENAKAIYSGAKVLDLIPRDVKTVGDLIVSYKEWAESNRSFADYKSELRRAIDRLDGEIAASRARIENEQKKFNDRTEKGLKEFCGLPSKLVATDDRITLGDKANNICIPVRNNDINMDVSPDRVRVSRVEIKKKASGKVSIGPGGTCINYQRTEFWITPFVGTDSFDYQITDETSGRTATATVTITVVDCNHQIPGLTGKEDPCTNTSSSEQLSQSQHSRQPTKQLDVSGKTLEDQNVDCPGKGLIRVDGSCWDRSQAEPLAAQKCDPKYGWGTCSSAEKMLAEAYGRNMSCESVTESVKVKNSAPTGYLDSYICVSKAVAHYLSIGFTRSDAEAQVSIDAMGKEQPSISTEDSVKVTSAVRTADHNSSNNVGGITTTFNNPQANERVDKPQTSINPESGKEEGQQTAAANAASPQNDVSGQACNYFTRPSVEHSNSMNVSSVSMNYYSNESVVCNGKLRYLCKNGRWIRISSDCSNEDPKQAWKLEGGQDAGSDDNQGKASGQSSGGGANKSGVMASPYDVASPFGQKSTQSSPYAVNSPYFSVPLHDVNGGDNLKNGLWPSKSAGERPGMGQRNPTSVGQGNGDVVLSQDCLRRQKSVAEELQRQFNGRSGDVSMCSTYANYAKWLEDGIRRIQSLPCPRNYINETIATMKTEINQARSSARTICSQ